MKRIVYFVVITLVLFSCKSGEYNVTGTVSRTDLNGKYIYLTERINRVWTPLDSVKIENGIFSFKGVCDSSRVVFISCELPNQELIREPFVLEGGKITITINKNMVTVTGTEQNDMLQAYMTKKNSLYEKAEELYKSFNDTLATTSEKAEFESKMTAFEKQITENDIVYATKYVNTVTGNYIFGSTFFGMTVEQKQNIVNMMSSETKLLPRIAEIIDAIKVEESTSKGQKFTDIELTGINGQKLALSALVGKSDYVLVDFWASWCGPCMRSLPELRTLYEKFKGAKFEIYGVSLDEDSTAWLNTINMQKINWKHVSDLKGWKSDGAAKYAVRSIPATVLIDKKGIIVGRNLKISEIESLLISTKK